MKKSIIIIALVTFMAACNTKTSENNTASDSTSHNTDKHTVYACPMDCEKGKTYDEPGKCPVCKMNLEKIKN